MAQPGLGRVPSGREMPVTSVTARTLSDHCLAIYLKGRDHTHTSVRACVRCYLHTPLLCNVRYKDSGQLTNLEDHFALLRLEQDLHTPSQYCTSRTAHSVHTLSQYRTSHTAHSVHTLSQYRTSRTAHP
eukprot:2852235-Rhodomonas_salina.1